MGRRGRGDSNYCGVGICRFRAEYFRGALRNSLELTMSLSVEPSASREFLSECRRVENADSDDRNRITCPSQLSSESSRVNHVEYIEKSALIKQIQFLPFEPSATSSSAMSANASRYSTNRKFLTASQNPPQVQSLNVAFGASFGWKSLESTNVLVLDQSQYNDTLPGHCVLSASHPPYPRARYLSSKDSRATETLSIRRARVAC